MTKNPPPVNDALPKQYRTALVGPGPHTIQHNLGLRWYMINVYDDRLNARFFTSESDIDEATISVGYFSTEGDWIPGCGPSEIIHVLIHA